jgi:hypothetical protein
MLFCLQQAQDARYGLMSVGLFNSGSSDRIVGREVDDRSRASSSIPEVLESQVQMDVGETVAEK